MKYQFKGIVRGAFSGYQAVGLEEPAVMSYEGNDLHDMLYGLALDEWLGVLKVNGRKIKDIMSYIKRQGLNPHDYMRYDADGTMQA